MPYTAEKRREYERKRDQKRRRDPGRRYVRAESARRRRAIKKVTERPTFDGFEGDKTELSPEALGRYLAEGERLARKATHGRRVAAFLEEVWAENPALYIRVMTKIQALTDGQLEKRERRDSKAIEIVNGLFALAEERMEQQDHVTDDREPDGERDRNGGLVILVVPYGSFPEKHRRAQKLGSTFEAILAEALRSRRVA